MSVHAAIHARWAASAAIIAIVPAERLTTGLRLDDDDTLPVAVLSLEGERISHSNSGPHERIASTRIQTWLRMHDSGLALADAIRETFDNASWTTGDVHVVLSRLENSFELLEPDGIWQFTFDIEVTYTQE